MSFSSVFYLRLQMLLQMAAAIGTSEQAKRAADQAYLEFRAKAPAQ